MTSRFPSVSHCDLSGLPGRAFVAGDVHGCFDALERALDEGGFDPPRDTLFLLGDLVDRGPDSLAARDWLHVARVRGNHEEMAWLAATGDARDIEFHVDNGGDWLQTLDRRAQRGFATALMAAPLAIELVTPRGRRVGLVHADVDGDDWPAFTAALSMADEDDEGEGRAAQVAMWSRRRIVAVEGDPDLCPAIAGIDHVFFGHNVVRTPLTRGNCSWIDTGAGNGWPLTLIDIDAYLDGC